MEEKKVVIPDKYRVLSGSALKMIALVAMLIDHTAVVLLRDSRIILLRTRWGVLTLYTLMRRIGRISFPIYCFLLVEGFLHTRDRRKYGRNLLLFALISEIPWNLEHTGTLRYGAQNVFFTLFLGYAGLCCIEYFREQPRKQLASLLLLVLVALNARADYGVVGFGLILLMYALRKQEILRAVIATCFLSSTWTGGLAFIPIGMYNGKRGFIRSRFLKYLFYAAYPLHITILYLIRKNTIGY